MLAFIEITLIWHEKYMSYQSFCFSINHHCSSVLLRHSSPVISNITHLYIYRPVFGLHNHSHAYCMRHCRAWSVPQRHQHWPASNSITIRTPWDIGLICDWMVYCGIWGWHGTQPRNYHGWQKHNPGLQSAAGLLLVSRLGLGLGKTISSLMIRVS